ncbi:SDR family oxidoreductase [Polymorphobacter sp.]|uniref:SDR family oxidoreductase n=1 Tax=Polymorphobacter sp. TaxID=1909290 RepID=UPI003F731069
MTNIVDRLFSVRGKVAIVTGGAKGVGAMIATTLVHAGAEVHVVARDAIKGMAFVEALAEHGTCHFHAHDLSEMAGVEAMVADIAGRCPRVHILVNNAGVFSTAPIGSVSAADFDHAMSVNLRAPFFIAQGLLLQLEAAAAAGDPARVINIGSVGALWAKSNDAFAYAASKAAIQRLTVALASDLTRRGITVNALAPGFFPSDMTGGFFAAVPDLEQQMIAGIPAGRLGTPEDIGGAILYLASRAGAYVSGTTLTVDGGLLTV